ncbi:MAG: nuclear transport factor 2 family protein [Flavisolibacter sp.]
MRKAFFSVLLFFVSFVVMGQPAPGQASAELDHALVLKDTNALRKLLDPCVTFGHSNAWLQSMREMMDDITRGKLNYTAIDNSEVKWETGTDRAIMRCTSNVKYLLEGKESSIKLHVVQVWVKKDKSWRLIARQAVKI